jgi:opacity protein-like surface antigen
MMIRKNISVTMRLVLGIVLLAASASFGISEAAQPVERHNWAAGVAYGFGPADVDLNSAELYTDWERGASPQIRLGRMIGSHFMIGVEDRQWIDEGGIRGYKVRGNIQNVSFVVTAYPGRTSDLTSGFMVQLGAGVAQARVSALEPYEEPNEWGETYEVVAKKDESGWGFLIGGGYELRVSSHFAVGAAVTFNSLEFNEQIFDRVKFIPGAFSLTWYF